MTDHPFPGETAVTPGALIVRGGAIPTPARTCELSCPHGHKRIAEPTGIPGISGRRPTVGRGGLYTKIYFTDPAGPCSEVTYS